MKKSDGVQYAVKKIKIENHLDVVSYSQHNLFKGFDSIGYFKYPGVHIGFL